MFTLLNSCIFEPVWHKFKPYFWGRTKVVFDIELCYKHEPYIRALVRMLYTSVKISIALLVLTTWIVPGDYGFGQDFPYIVPEAPEFDSAGSIEKPSLSNGPGDQKKPFRPSPGIFKPQFEAGSVSPSQAPEAPVANDGYSSSPRSGPVRVPSAEVQQVPPSMAPPQKPVASAPPSGVTTGMRPRTDCSEFPMMIARSRSDTEMQMTARHYLTCLMQGGWTMEQARDQVIRTIETAYRTNR